MRELIESYAAFNPHATFSLQIPDLTIVYPATAPGWPKWRPSDPTSPFWYETDHLTALIAAYLTRERADARARTLREFVAEFYGLSANAKQKAVLEIAALPRRYLHDLVEGNAWREEEPERLLEAMQRQAKRVNPKVLGVLGRDHLSRVLCEQHGCEAETVSYKKVVAEASGPPFVLEVACGVYVSENASISAVEREPPRHAEPRRQLITMPNHTSPAQPLLRHKLIDSTCAATDSLEPFLERYH